MTGQNHERLSDEFPTEGGPFMVYVSPVGCVEVTEIDRESPSHKSTTLHICDWPRFSAGVNAEIRRRIAQGSVAEQELLKWNAQRVQRGDV